MWIIALFSKTANEPIIVKRGVSKQPLRFDNQAYAEREAYESNTRLSDAMKTDGFYWIVMEDNRFYEKDIEVGRGEDF